MAAKMAADFLENGCIHKISYHNMLLLGFWTQNYYIRYKENVSCHFIMAKHQKYFSGA